MAKLNGRFVNELNIDRYAEAIATIASDRSGYKVTVASIRKRTVAEVGSYVENAQSAYRPGQTKTPTMDKR